MTFCIMFLSPEYRACLKYSVKYANHHLFVELWALHKYCRYVEVAELEKVCPTLCSSGYNIRSVNLCKTNRDTKSESESAI